MIKGLDEFIDWFREIEVLETLLDPRDGSYMSLLCQERRIECQRLADWLQELKDRRAKDEK